MKIWRGGWLPDKCHFEHCILLRGGEKKGTIEDEDEEPIFLHGQSWIIIIIGSVELLSLRKDDTDGNSGH